MNRGCFLHYIFSSINANEYCLIDNRSVCAKKMFGSLLWIFNQNITNIKMNCGQNVIFANCMISHIRSNFAKYDFSLRMSHAALVWNCILYKDDSIANLKKEILFIFRIYRGDGLTDLKTPKCHWKGDGWHQLHWGSPNRSTVFSYMHVCRVSVKRWQQPQIFFRIDSGIADNRLTKLLSVVFFLLKLFDKFYS